jgi:hypothetical protein
MVDENISVNSKATSAVTKLHNKLSKSSSQIDFKSNSQSLNHNIVNSIPQSFRSDSNNIKNSINRSFAQTKFNNINLDLTKFLTKESAQTSIKSQNIKSPQTNRSISHSKIMTSSEIKYELCSAQDLIVLENVNFILELVENFVVWNKLSEENQTKKK